MNKKHEKSPCCKENIWRISGRRRQCATCKKTWRVWKRKRGRRRKRTSHDLAHKFVFHRLLPVRAGFPATATSRNRRQYRLAQSRRFCASTCVWKQPSSDKKLIMVADALVKFVENRWQTWYFIFVRSIDSDSAVALPPYHRQGTETITGWREAFDSVDVGVLSRIQALVCDGHRGLTDGARERGFKLQRCHFHLIARIQNQRSRWKSGRNYQEGQHIYTRVKQVLEDPSDENLAPVLNELEEMSWTSSSAELRRVLGGFVNNFQDYRTYLHYPKLNLPTTNNTAESFIGTVEEVCRRARGFKNLTVLSEWIMCASKTRGGIKCRGRSIPN